MDEWLTLPARRTDLGFRGIAERLFASYLAWRAW
jgi:hypothetical protein